MKTPFIVGLLLTFIVLQPQMALAENSVDKVIEAAADAGFSELERQIIETWFKDHKTEEKPGSNNEKKDKQEKKNSSKKMPSGLAKKEKLPPGLAMQLEKNGTLPPGLAKRELPDDLQEQLPEIQDRLERTIIDSSVVLVEKATGRILDVIKDVVTQ